ncbi:MAG: GDSL-type esterase/lipase family protein [Fibromonadaceae bacterium]|jgi:hypothetical protein|nr:GDSL-type esterase/lipase family protein [Fibromonadaceae bacterium]
MTKIAHRAFLVLLCLISVLSSSGRTLKQENTVTPFIEPSFLQADLEAEGMRMLNVSHLYPFFERLIQFEADTAGKINVVHIGDSHVQSNSFSNAMRRLLQRTFGNGGYGFVFPYRFNRPGSSSGTFRFITDTQWQVCRNNQLSRCDQGTEFGLSGYGLSTASEEFVVKLEVVDSRFMFNTIKVVSPDTPSTFNLAAKNGTDTSLFKPLKYQQEKQHVAEYRQDELVSEIYLVPAKKQPIYNFNGIILERDDKGLIYHNIGTVGSMASHFNATPLFFEQLPVLTPDLFIVSFGTNESFSRISAENFINNMDLLIANIRKLSPNVPVIVTTPPTSLLRDGRPNTFVEEYSSALMQAADFAVWDLYSFTGGFMGAIENPAATNLTQDNIHYTVQGYNNQGTAFAGTILHDYEKYKQFRNRTENDF